VLTSLASRLYVGIPAIARPAIEELGPREEIMTDDEAAKRALRAELEEAKTWGRKYRYVWSIATASTAWLVPSLGAAAGIATQSKYEIGGVPIAEILSGLVVVISSVHLSLGFHRKWGSYRRTQTAARLLLLDLEMGASVSQIREKLEAIYKQHDDEIIGDDPYRVQKKSSFLSSQ
jgi:hypothetical protein